MATTKIEFAIGEEFDLGLKRIKVIESYTCEKCILKNVPNCEDFHFLTGTCYATKRNDNKAVQFIDITNLKESNNETL